MAFETSSAGGGEKVAEAGGEDGDFSDEEELEEEPLDDEDYDPNLDEPEEY